ncbi:MAG: hypothetical protein IPK82_11165 [Polyangiaceae bacterium]|nr:hypothetical protein [Polyangiaceae bacterium]
MPSSKSTKTKPNHSTGATKKSDPAAPALPADVGTYDRAYGEGAFNAWQDRIDAVPEAALVSARTDVQRAGMRALALAANVLAPAAHARLAALPATEFDMSHVHNLAPLASALIYVHEQAGAAGAYTTEAKLPAELAKASAECEKRMQTLCEYHFGDDPVIGSLLAELAPGTDYRDRAADLLGYARIYEMRPEAVKADAKHYRPTDVADARKYAGQILAALRDADSPKARLWGDRLVKVFTLLYAAHAEVRATWLWLERKDAGAAERFPSLYAPPPGSRPRKTAAKAPEPGPAPT